MNKKYFYQPDIPVSISCWSFTLMILLFSLLLWLEITVFQIWTVITFIIKQEGLKMYTDECIQTFLENQEQIFD